VIPWLELADLAVDDEGQVWRILDADGAPLRRQLWELRGIRRDRRLVRLGDVEDRPAVPESLATQLAQILDHWRHDRRDERREWRDTFVRQTGVFSRSSRASPRG
jgi:hypothetical protein